MKAYNRAFVVIASFFLLVACSLSPVVVSRENNSQQATSLSLAVEPPTTSPALPIGMGAFRIQINWPNAKDLRTLAIPVRTDRFVVTIQGTGIQPAITKTITQTVSNGTQTEQILVPAGSSRLVTINALSTGGSILASGFKNGITVTTGQLTPVTVSITSVVGNVAGKVMDDETGSALIGATVRVDGSNLSSTTDGNGDYTILDLPVGACSLTISKTGYKSAKISSNLTISADVTTRPSAVRLPVAHWFRQLTSISTSLKAVHFADAQTGSAVGDDGNIVTTSDGGRTWNQQTISDYHYGTLSSVHFFDPLNGFAVGDTYSTSDLLLKTRDGGLSWSKIYTQDRDMFSDVVMLDANHVIVIGYFNIHVTADGGDTWQTKMVPRPLGDGGSQVFFRSFTRGWSIWNGHVYFTNNGGDTWSQLPLPSGVDGFQTVYFSDDFNGSAITATGTTYRTDDGGVSWTWYGAPPSPMSLNKFHFNNQNFGYGVANGGKVYLTTDGGLTWKTQTLADDSTTNLYDAFFLDSQHGWAVGAAGRIYRYSLD